MAGAQSRLQSFALVPSPEAQGKGIRSIRFARASARRQSFGVPSAAQQSSDCGSVKTKQTCSKS